MSLVFGFLVKLCETTQLEEKALGGPLLAKSEINLSYARSDNQRSPVLNIIVTFSTNICRQQHKNMKKIKSGIGAQIKTPWHCCLK